MRRLLLIATLLVNGCTVNRAEFTGRPLSDGGTDAAGDVSASDDRTAGDGSADVAGDAETSDAAIPEDGADAAGDTASPADASDDIATADDRGVASDAAQADAEQDGAGLQGDGSPQTDVLQTDVAPQTDALQMDVAPPNDAAPPSDGPYSTAGWHDLTPGTLPPDWPAARGQHAMVYDRARHRAVLFGGANNSTAFNDTWEWDGSAWALRNNSPPPGGPGNCYGHVMTYDATRGVSVAFGCGAGDELWEWNGTTWSNRTPTPRPALWPPHRTCCAAATFDGVRGRTVLFGGVWNSPITYYADTWEWDGTNWTHALDGPTTLASHAMSYDEGRRLSLVHGGGNGTSWRLTQVLEWDGTAWATRDPSGTPPPGRTSPTMVYDSRRQVSILFAGSNTSALADTWEYDGSTRWWTDRSAFTGPHARSQHAAVFNPDRGTMLVFGGDYYVSPNTFYLNDLWEYQGL